jgi:mutator protein MutT
MQKVDGVVDFALLRFTDRRILIQKRSFNRRLFPGKWELPGGHLERGETRLDCIRRELREELGLSLSSVLGLLHEFKWKDGIINHWIYAVTAVGNPRLEADKVICQRWIDKSETGLLQDDDLEPNGLVIGVRKAFDLLDRGGCKCPSGMFSG